MGRAPAIALDDIRGAMHRLFIGAPGTALRREDEQKCLELQALLGELGRFRTDRLVVDAAAGKAPVGLLGVELLGLERLVVIERAPDRIAAVNAAVGRLTREAEVEVRRADVGDAAAWPAEPDVVVALHACGSAADRIIDSAVSSGARWILLAPCCYGRDVRFAAQADGRAADLAIPHQAAVRTRFFAALVDAERTLRLEAAGYETTVAPFVAPTVTPHNLLWRCRRTRVPKAMARAREQLARLRGG